MSDNNIENILITFKDLYLKKDFNACVDLLLKEKESFNPGLFHYNLGTVYLKLEKPAIGRYHLEKARKEQKKLNRIKKRIDKKGGK